MGMPVKVKMTEVYGGLKLYCLKNLAGEKQEDESLKTTVERNKGQDYEVIPEIKQLDFRSLR